MTIGDESVASICIGKAHVGIPCERCGHTPFSNDDEWALQILRHRITSFKGKTLSEWREFEYGSPITAFEKWALRWTKDNGRKFTQTEYGIAYSAFIAAHPGEGPKSNTMSVSKLF